MSRDKDLGQELHTRTGTLHGRTRLATIHPKNGSGTWTGTWQRRAPEVSDCKPREDVRIQSVLRIRQKDKRYWMSAQGILFDVIIQYG